MGESGQSRQRNVQLAGLAAIFVCMLGLVFVVFKHIEVVRAVHEEDTVLREKAHLTQEIRGAVYLRTYMLPYVATLEDFFDRDEEHMRFNALAVRVANARSRLLEIGLTPDEEKIFEKTTEEILGMRDFVEAAIQLAVDEPDGDAFAMTMNEAHWRQLELLETLDRFANYFDRVAEEKFLEAQNSLNVTQSWVTALSIIFIFLALLAGIYVFRREQINTRLLLRAVEERTHELRIERDRSETANRTKSEFLANMSHELRSPLNAIIGFSESMRLRIFGELGNKKYSEYVDNINESGNHLLELIDDILDLSVIEAGAVELDEGEIDVAKTIAVLASMIRPRAEKARIKLSVDFPDNQILLRGDRRRFKQIVINLMTNAVKFTPKRGKVSISARYAQDGSLSIAIQDTGIGIAPSDTERVMSTFGQVGSTIRRKSEGVGLGLPICKHLVELHDGRLEMDSAPGEGTTMTMLFPPARVISNELNVA